MPISFTPSTNEADNEVNLQEHEGKSLLQISAQRVVIMLFHVNQMKNEVKEFEINVDKMPLVKLSKKQLTAAYTLHTDI